MDKSNDESPRPLATPNTTDDESSLTTSTASDSWTLVTDKNNPKTTTITTTYHEEESNIEDLPRYEDLNLEASEIAAQEEQEEEPSPEYNADTMAVADELSDEVSIISESENGDVIPPAPRPNIRDHLQKLNWKFTTGEGVDFATLFQLQQQQEHRLQQNQATPPNTPIQLQQNSSTQTKLRKRRSPSIDKTQKTIVRKCGAPSSVCANIQAPSYFIKRVYTLFFYFVCALILIGVLSKLFHTEWPSFSRDPGSNINSLEKKLIDMELQNNLMRAEIDLLSKQVNYLKTASPNKHGESSEKKYQPIKEKKQYLRDERNINREPTWSTEGSTQNQEFVKDAAELPNDEIIFDAVYPTSQPPIDVVYEELPTPAENNEAAPKKHYDDEGHVLTDRFRKENRDRNEEKRRNRNESEGNFKRHNKKYNSKERFDDDDDDDDDDSKERKQFKKESKERYNERNNSKERRNQKEDNEKKSNNKQNSKEDYRRNENFKKYDSKESKHQKRRGKSSNEHDNEHSGEWHEKRMQHREKSRNEQEQRVKREKNWYLNRNDAREQLRVDEMRSR